MSIKFSIVKKNQILAWVFTLVLCVAGVLNYTSDSKKNYQVEVSGKMEESLGEAVLVDSSQLLSNVDDYVEELNETSKMKTAAEYFAQCRMNRNLAYDEQIEVYEKMLENDSLPEKQIEMAQNEIKQINEQKNAIAIAENLLKLKGFGEVVILKNASSINVIVAEVNLSEAKIAQIQYIIQNELGAKAEDIHVNNL